MLSKTAILSAGASLSVAAISNELYVVNEESIVMLSLLTVFWGIYNYLGPSYSQWAEGYIDKLKKIMQTAREDHKEAVQSRIDSVQGVGEVVQITKDLFAVSKVCQLDAETGWDDADSESRKPLSSRLRHLSSSRKPH